MKASRIRQGQISVNAILGVVVALIVVVVVALPVVSDAITEQNFSGTVGTVTDTIPIFIAIGGLVLAGAFFLFRR